MKKFLFASLIVFIAVLLLVSCGKKPEQSAADENPQETQSPETTPPKKEYYFGDITYNSLKKRNFYKVFEAPEGNPRQIVIDYMRKMATVEWVASETWTTTWKNEGNYKVNLKYYKGKTYYGLPYSNCGTDFNCFMEYVEDGVFTPNSHYHEELVGNHCSYSMVRSYQQVLNFTGTGTLKPSSTSQRGKMLMFPAGSGLEKPVKDDNWYSADLLKHNGMQKSFEAFALLDAGDMLYKHTTGAGHTRMVAGKPEVVRKADGTINHNKSYVTVIEQTNAWFDKKENSTWFLDKKYSFADLYANSFMPITLKFFNEENPVITDAYISYTGKNTPESIKGSINGTIQSNYAFTYILVSLKDADGNTIKTWTMNQNLTINSLNSSVFYNVLGISSLPAGTYTYNLRVGIARGNCDVETITFTIGG